MVEGPKPSLIAPTKLTAFSSNPKIRQFRKRTSTSYLNRLEEAVNRLYVLICFLANELHNNEEQAMVDECLNRLNNSIERLTEVVNNTNSTVRDRRIQMKR